MAVIWLPVLLPAQASWFADSPGKSSSL